MSSTRLFGALAALLIICACAPQAHAARAPKPFYGLMAAQDPTPSEIDRMGDGRVGTLRINFVWSAVQPREFGPLDWDYYDKIIGKAADRGIQVLPTVYSTPRWAARRANHPPKKSHLDDFRTFVRTAVERYGPDGSFWETHPEISSQPIAWWQFWNEPNFPNFWSRRIRSSTSASCASSTAPSGRAARRRRSCWPASSRPRGTR
jgi:hypothetical protein